jgi:arabinofuranosyltransferase
MTTRTFPDLARKYLLPRDAAGWTLVIACVFVAIVSSWFARLYHGNVIDDAYISFQYAKNWSLGRGIVFNPGERVEGYTNFLWVALLTPLYPLTRAVHWDFTRTVIHLNILLAVVDLGLVYLVARRLFSSSRLATAVPLVLLALDNSYLGYAASGLENHLVIGCMIGAVAVWQARPRRAWLWTGLLLSLLNMSRPDAALVVAAFGLSALIAVVWRDPAFAPEPRRTTVARVFATIGVYVVVYGAYFLWRWHYYGYLFPNTFYLKVGDTFDAVQRGLGYTRSFFENRYFVPAVALLALPGIRNSVVRWLVLIVLLHVPYVTYVGGDFYSGHRFYVAVLPVFYLLAGWAVHRVGARISRLRLWARARRSGPVVAPLIGVTSGAAAWLLSNFTLRGFETGPYTNEIVLFSEMVDNNVRYMKWLGTFAEPGASMALGDIGAAGFFADVKVIDTYGVVDPVIAHRKIKGFGKGKPGHEKVASREYVMQRNPTYVKWGYVPGDLRPYGYYLFTEFPPGFRTDALWVREDLGPGYFLQDTAIHFVEAELRDWERSGDAFRDVPTVRPVPGQLNVFGQEGPYIDSFTPNAGDRATGRLVSPPFLIEGDLMLLRVGGGRDAERLRVSLLIDDERAFNATGHDHEVLGRRVWRIEPFKGRMARLEIVDNATGRWGHILVDEVAQWVRTPR